MKRLAVLLLIVPAIMLAGCDPFGRNKPKPPVITKGSYRIDGFYVKEVFNENYIDMQSAYSRDTRLAFLENYRDANNQPLSAQDEAFATMLGAIGIPTLYVTDYSIKGKPYTTSGNDIFINDEYFGFFKYAKLYIDYTSYFENLPQGFIIVSVWRIK
ncbi:MAG: hypothetical protein LBG88_03330 [Christensenellaceae bacterium]|jgi:hypothetical protein|nr:hypothetical protein [Christensenellaceae bacterium]